MKFIIKYILVLGILSGCIGTDIQSEQEEILRISGSSSILRVTGTYQFEFEYINSLGQSPSISAVWNSSNASVIAIDDTGMASAMSEGTAEVSVHFGELSDSMIIQVLPSKEAIVISNFVNIIEVGNTMEFEAVYLDLNGQADIPDDKIWSSSDPTILSVNAIADGKATVTAHATGTVTVTVQAGNVMNSITVESTSDAIMIPEEIRITQFTNAMNLDDSFTFEAMYFDTGGIPDQSVAINWSSSDNTVVSINSDGVASAISAGQVNIIATVGSTQTEVAVEVIGSTVTERTVTLGGAAYQISGTAVLKEVNGDVVLEINNAVIGRPAPGPYFYLSNSAGSVNNGVNLGKMVEGSSTINVSDISADVTLTEFDFLVIWCEPFNITLGFGEFDN